MKKNIISFILIVIAFSSCNSTKKSTDSTISSKAETVEVKQEDPKLVEGKELYTNHCGKCHQLYKTTDYTATQWKPIADRMQRKARLDDQQMSLVYNYLAENAKP